MNNNKGILNNIDWVLVSLYLALSFIGIALIYSTAYSANNNAFFNFDSSHGKQFIWLLVSLLISTFIIVIDYKFYTSFSFIIYAATMLLLASVLIFGVEINGSKSWFAVGSFRFQPAEIAKFATCLALAKTLSNPNINLLKMESKWKAIIVLAIPISLILFQGDVGSAVVFSSLIFVLHREGLESAFLIIGFSLIFLSIMALLYNPFVLLYAYAIVLCLFVLYNRKSKYPILNPLFVLIGSALYAYLFYHYLMPNDNYALGTLTVSKYIILLLPAIALLLTGYKINFNNRKWVTAILVVFSAVAVYTFSVDFMFNNVLKQHHRDRINLILGKMEDPSGAGYNLFQSKVAIGSGGFIGKGYLQGTQTMLNFVPEQSTDFIFTSLAEQFGFIGSFVLILLYVLLLLRILDVAERQRSTFARVYAYGVASILFIHFAVNIGMTIGLVPVIGIPLPFVSYGGSSLLSFTILLFTLIKFDTERQSVLR